MSKPSSSSSPAAFETCFAQGLDLSEFVSAAANNNNNKTTTTSHAAQHLATTVKRAAKRVAADQQEWALTAAVQAKSRAVATRNKPTSAVHAAVLQMHAGETEGRQRFVKKGPKTMSKKNAVAKRAKPLAKGKRRGK